MCNGPLLRPVIFSYVKMADAPTVDDIVVRYVPENVTSAIEDHLYNNFSAISWRSVLMVEERRLSGENHRPAQVTDKLSHNVVSSTPRQSRIRTYNVGGDRQ
jgi:hypothetical protein